MDKLSWGDRLEDRITFGVGYIPFLGLLVIVFFAFVFGLIRFQNINAPYGPLSTVLYLSITIVALVVAYAILRRIGTWTFSQALHHRTSVIGAVAIYFSGTLFAVFLGYLIINPQASAVGRLGPPDVIVGVTIASVYTSILGATSLYQDPAELLGKPNERMRCMQEWLQAHEEAKAADRAGYSQTKAHTHFIKQSEALLDELDNAKTNEGEQLRRIFKEWFMDFQGRNSSVSREAILTGETENQRLADEHQRLTWIREQVTDIGGDETWTNTNR